MRWFLIVVSICLFQMMSDAEHFFMYVLATCKLPVLRLLSKNSHFTILSRTLHCWAWDPKWLYYLDECKTQAEGQTGPFLEVNVNTLRSRECLKHIWEEAIKCLSQDPHCPYVCDSFKEPNRGGMFWVQNLSFPSYDWFYLPCKSQPQISPEIATILNAPLE